MSESEKALLVKAKLARAEALLREIESMLTLGYLETAANRCYYCCFYCAQALLAQIDLYPKSHKGVLSQFNLQLARTGRFLPPLSSFLQDAFVQRQMADYNEAFKITPETAAIYLDKTRLFYQTTADLLSQTN